MAFALPINSAAENIQQSQQQHQQAPQQLQLPQQPQSQGLYNNSLAHQARQQQHYGQQPHHNVAMNGMNGANMGAAIPSGPTPAGHQAELNYIYGMVEELSKQLADNRRVTEDIVSGLGRVRNRAKNQSLSNDELIDSAAQDIDGKFDRLPPTCSSNPACSLDAMEADEETTT